MSASASIVMAGEFWFGASGAGLAHGFRELGFDVGEVDVREHVVQGRRPAFRIAARLLAGEAARSYNAAIVYHVSRVRPRALVVVKGTQVTTATLQQVKRLGVTTVNYYPDFHFDYHGLDRETFQHYDLFFTTKSFQVAELSKELGSDRVRFLHHGYSDLVHRPRVAVMAETGYVRDVLYVGNHSVFKERWLTALATALPGVRLTVAGDRWTRPMFEAHPQVEVIEHTVAGDFFARLLQTARINVAIHSGRHEATGWEDLVSTRTFEIPACRGFMLHVDNDEVRTLFQPETEIGVFTTVEDLGAKITHYLARPDLRAAMISRAYARCVPAYGYDERARSIAGELEQFDSAELLSRPSAG